MQKVKDILACISRLILGATFVFSGVVKAIDPLGTTYKIEDYLKAFGGFWTDLLPCASWAAMGLIALECVLGVCLLLAIRVNWVKWLTLAFYSFMLPLTLYIAIVNPVSDCGCFGDALVLSNWQTFGKNVVLMVLTILLVLLHRADSRWKSETELAIVGIAFALTMAGMVITLRHLPILDFRPYKVGNHIPSLMEYPEDAPHDEYEIHLIYQKNGVEQVFTLENYPKGDSTWTFVRQDSKLIKKGYEPPIHDFEIINSDYEDITFDILEAEDKVTLVVMYDMEKSDMKQLSKILTLYDKATTNDEGFYILTGSSSDAVETFLANEGAEVLRSSVCTCDPVTLKTIVRANPGVVELKEGIITNKYNLRNK